MKKDSGRTQWHQLLGSILHELLQPVGIQVLTEFQLSPAPPIGDILILRPKGKSWTKAQRERLPDGIRDSKARDILIEFKYSESLNLKTLKQAVMSQTLYCRTNDLDEKRVAFFVILARQPRPAVLQWFGYRQTKNGRPLFQ